MLPYDKGTTLEGATLIKKEICLLVGPSSVIGNSIVMGLVEFNSIPILKFGRTEQIDIFRIEGLQTLELEENHFEGDLDSVMAFLKSLNIDLKFIVLSTGYMPESSKQFESNELLMADQANIIFPLLVAVTLENNYFFNSKTRLIVVSSALYSLPYQKKHVVYQISKEHFERLMIQFWEYKKRYFFLYIVRPWHIPTPMNYGIPSSRFSINPELISATISQDLSKTRIWRRRQKIGVLYIPEYVRLMIPILRILPNKLFTTLAKMGSKSR